MFQRLIVLAVLLVMPVTASAASSTKTAGTGTSEAWVGGDLDWTSPTNIQANNDTYATVNLDGRSSDDDSYYLQGVNFGFAIPTGATINGIVLSTDKYHAVQDGPTSDEVVDSVIQLVVAGVVAGNNKSIGADWNQDTEQTDTYGGISDTWGLTPTAAQINASNFGAVIAAHKDGGTGDESIAYVDNITITVYYTESVPDLHEWAMIFLVIGGVYYLYREGVLDGLMN